jgi:ABC-2 type transport system permease protein
MTTAPTTRRAAAAARKDDGIGLTFLRTVHAEWIKLTSLRSSYIILTIALLGMIGVGLLSTYAVINMATGYRAYGGDPAGSEAQLGTVAEFGVMARGIPATGIAIGQFLIASLAVMQIGSEYGTRMITTTLTAVPRRITAILAKTLVVAGVSFVVGVAAALVSYAVAQPIVEPHGLSYQLFADGVIRGIVGTGAYLALIAVLGLGIGTLLRNSAGGIVATLGVLIVLPIIVAILSSVNESFRDLGLYLPTSAGNDMVAIRTAQDHLTQVQGGLVVLAWAAVFLAGALVTVKRRDA